MTSFFKSFRLNRFSAEVESEYNTYLENRVDSAFRYTAVISALYAFFFVFRDYYTTQEWMSVVCRLSQTFVTLGLLGLTLLNKKILPNAVLAISGVLFFAAVQVFMHFEGLTPAESLGNVYPLFFFSIGVGLGLKFKQALTVNTISMSYFLFGAFVLKDSNHLFSVENVFMNYIVATGLSYYYERELRISFKRSMRLRNLNEELKVANETKLNLLSIITHDINSPLDNLTSVIDLKTSEVIDEKEMNSILGQLKYRVQSISQLLFGLTHWAKSQIDGFKPKYELVIFMDLFSEVEDSLASQAEDKNVALIMKTNPELSLWTDAKMLSIALRNVISNAIKFSDAGDSVSIVTFEEDKCAFIQITDQGRGMTSQELNQLFTYHAMSKKGTNQEKGTGLGMYISYELITRMGGELSVESEIEMGTTFTFRLPLAR